MAHGSHQNHGSWLPSRWPQDRFNLPLAAKLFNSNLGQDRTCSCKTSDPQGRSKVTNTTHSGSRCWKRLYFLVIIKGYIFGLYFQVIIQGYIFRVIFIEEVSPKTAPPPMITEFGSTPLQLLAQASFFPFESCKRQSC